MFEEGRFENSNYRKGLHEEFRSTDIDKNPFLKEAIDKSIRNFTRKTGLELRRPGENDLKIKFLPKLDMFVIFVNPYNSPIWRNFKSIIEDLENIAEEKEPDFNKALDYYRDNALSEYCEEFDLPKEVPNGILTRLRKLNNDVRKNKKVLKPLVFTKVF